MIHSFEFKKFYTCYSFYDYTYAIWLFKDGNYFIYNENKNSRLFNRTFYKL